MKSAAHPGAFLRLHIERSVFSGCQDKTFTQRLKDEQPRDSGLTLSGEGKQHGCVRESQGSGIAGHIFAVARLSVH